MRIKVPGSNSGQIALVITDLSDLPQCVRDADRSSHRIVGYPYTVTQSISHGSEVSQPVISQRSGIAALGRFVVTREPTDIGKFRTPSLRNVALTAPYMHDGSVKTLQDAVDVELYSRATALNYPIALTVSERQDLVEFLKSLASPYANSGSVGKPEATRGR